MEDGYNGLGNFDDDPFPEVVLIGSGDVWLLEHTGEVKWGPVSSPTDWWGGGAPLVADVDNDGEPEIGYGGPYRYVVLETDGSVKWTSITRDGSSGRTGSSAFDFEADGYAEIVYADEEYLRRSILETNAHIVKGFPANVMPSTYKDTLSKEQVDALVEYIKSLAN